jgi:glycosyltransferase involved in cell wall biosynthesis
MKILLINTYDQAGGAEKVASDLLQSYKAAGHDVRLLVRYKRTDLEDIIEIDPYKYTSGWASVCAAIEPRIRRLPRFRGQYRLVDGLRLLAYPQRWLDRWRGIEDFNYPQSSHLLNKLAWCPDIVHAHNLHGNYFDLHALADMSRQVPVVWTLHDTWALTGHCGYFINCERWRSGCGNCPDLERPPAIIHDGTMENWQRKYQIYANSQLAVATPSRWLMNYVEQSTLNPWQRRVIHNGVNTSVYHSGDRRQARIALGLPPDGFICMYVAFSGNTANPYKDFTTAERAVRLVTEHLPSTDVAFVCLGESRHYESESDTRFHYVGYIADPYTIVQYYQAADILLHAANAENFPCVVLEALACGTPVIATAVGGIPEQIVDGETGFLVPRGDSKAMAQRIIQFINQPDLAQHMGVSAIAYVQQAFALDQQATRYLEWFEELQVAYQQKSVCN